VYSLMNAFLRGNKNLNRSQSIFRNMGRREEDVVVGTFVNIIVSSSSPIHDETMEALRVSLVAASNFERSFEDIS
jgi:hypothetical protein